MDKELIVADLEKQRLNHVKQMVKEFRDLLNNFWKSFQHSPDSILRVRCSGRKDDVVAVILEFTPLLDSLVQIIHMGYNPENPISEPLKEFLQNIPDISPLKIERLQIKIANNFALTGQQITNAFKDVIINLFEKSITNPANIHFLINCNNNHEYQFHLDANSVTFEYQKALQILEMETSLSAFELLNLEYIIEYLKNNQPPSTLIKFGLEAYSCFLKRIFNTPEIYLNFVAPAMDQKYKCPWETKMDI
jgi:hypothetical protein